MSDPVRSGLEVLAGTRGHLLQGRSIGLVVNPASVDARLRHAVDVLAALPGVRVAALFAPEHGVRGEAQDMEPVSGGREPATGLPVHSLYGTTVEALEPTARMLAGLDALVVDLPDVGARYYTFAATLFHVMEAAARGSVPVVVLDRPNPLGGEVLEGPALDPAYASFVGRLDVPVRHGLTIGELAGLYRSHTGLDVDLQIVPMQGWRREMLWEATGLPWVLPSPNMPSPDTAFVYPGGCLVEGTNLSEGRGTTRPFELVGAPWIDGAALAVDLGRLDLPGVRFRAHWFRPLAQKWRGETCGGVQVHVTDRRAFGSFRTYVELIVAARKQDPRRFAWRTAVYEFDSEHPAIDLLAGSGSLRHDIEAGRSPDAMSCEWRAACEMFASRRAPTLLYP